MTMDKQWGWKSCKGVRKAIEIEIKGYIIDLFDGLKVR